jgi:hypothetical protein
LLYFCCNLSIRAEYAYTKKSHHSRLFSIHSRYNLLINWSWTTEPVCVWGEEKEVNHEMLFMFLSCSIMHAWLKSQIVSWEFDRDVHRYIVENIPQDFQYLITSIIIEIMLWCHTLNSNEFSHSYPCSIQLKTIEIEWY